MIDPILCIFENNILGCCSGVPYTPPTPLKISSMTHTLICAHRGTKGKLCEEWTVAIIGRDAEFEMVVCSFLLSLLSSLHPSLHPSLFHFPSFLPSTVRKTKQDRQTDSKTIEQVLVVGYGTLSPENLLTHNSFSQLQTSKTDAPEEDPKLCVQRLHHQVRTLQCQLRDQGWALRELQAARDEAVSLQEKLKGKVGWANPSRPPNVSRPQGASTNSLMVLARDLKTRMMCGRKAGSGAFPGSCSPLKTTCIYGFFFFLKHQALS